MNTSSQLQLYVISFSNIIDEGYKNYEASLQKFGYNYTILGQGIKWKGFVKTKIRNIYKHLKTLPQNNTVVCITDVNDVIACCGPDEVLSKFKQFDSNIVLGVEETNFFFNCIKEQRNKFPNHIKRVYANGGFYMGYTPDIIKMYDYMFTLGENDDQLCLGTYNINHDEHSMDIKSKIVYNLFNNTYKIKDNRIYVPYSKEYPCFVHMMGKFTCNPICKTILGKDYCHISFYSAAMHNLGKLKMYFNQLKYVIFLTFIVMCILLYCIFDLKVMFIFAIAFLTLLLCLI
jgi:hypothetical protein